jgi:aspartate/methionine/tyrosine aminotransferase
MLAEYAARRDLLSAALQGIDGVRLFEPRGTFFTWIELEPQLFARLGVQTTDDISERLCQQGVGNTPGDAFGPVSVGSMRFSFSCETAMVRDGAAVLRRVLLG